MNPAASTSRPNPRDAVLRRLASSHFEPVGYFRSTTMSSGIRFRARKPPRRCACAGVRTCRSMWQGWIQGLNTPPSSKKCIKITPKILWYSCELFFLYTLQKLTVDILSQGLLFLIKSGSLLTLLGQIGGWVLGQLGPLRRPWICPDRRQWQRKLVSFGVLFVKGRCSHVVRCLQKTTSRRLNQNTEWKRNISFP